MKKIVTKIEVRKATDADEQGVVDLLENFYPGVPDHWRKIFKKRPWEVENNYPGFVITDDNKVVGYLGTIFSEHLHPQGKITICNLTSWYVHPAYRQHGMLLFMKVMKIPNVVWTNLTAAPHTYEWLKRSGFKTLEDTQQLIFPLPKLSSQSEKIKIKTTVSEEDLETPLKSVYRMHQGLECKHLLIEKGDEQCYCLVVVTRYKKIPLAKIYYISNSSLFTAVINQIRAKLCLKLRVCYLQVEGQVLAENKMRGVFVKKLNPPRLYKSDTLNKEDIPLLGSELFVLGI